MGSAASSSTHPRWPGIEGQVGQIAYSASKGGIIGMTVPAARDLSAIGVRVITICPGIIDTPIYGFEPRDPEAFKAGWRRRSCSPSGWAARMNSPSWCSALIENDYLNAEVIRLDGGIRFQPR